MRINYRSDFDFFIRLFDCDGKPVGMPRDIELDMQLITGWLDELDAEEWCPKLAGFSQGAYTAKYRKDVTENCMVEGGKLRVIVDNHNLTPGALTIEMTLKLPRTIYPDGDQRIVAKKKTCIELITGRGDAWTDSPTIDFYLPVSLPQADQSAVMTQPLPFRFGVVGDKPAPGHPVFDREYGRFFRPVKDHNAEEIDPADGPYNIYAADGRIIANTDRLFICGRTVYRYTGRELVNVAIEQNPNQRLVCRTPSVNAHPGLVYLDRGFIRLPAGGAGTEVRVSLKNMYLQWFDGCGYTADADGLIPLMELSRHYNEVVSEPVVDGDTLTYTVEHYGAPYMRLALCADQTTETPDPPITILPLSEDGDAAAASGKAIVKPGGTGGIGGIVRPPVTGATNDPVDDAGFWPGNRRPGGYIGVRCDSLGRTIFYRLKKAFGTREVMPPSGADVDGALMRLYPRYGNRPTSSRGETWGSFRIGMESRILSHRHERLQIEVWKRKRLRWRRDRDGNPVARWKWRRVGTDTRIGARNCLIRARRLVGTARSPWAYFNVVLMKSGRIYPAVQTRL